MKRHVIILMCLAIGVCLATAQSDVDLGSRTNEEFEEEEDEEEFGDNPNTTTTEMTPTTTTPVTTEIPTTVPTTVPVTTEIPTTLPTTVPPPVPTAIPPGVTNTCENFTTTIDSCKFNYNVTINAKSPCIFNCTYDPSKLSPLRLEVHLAYKHSSHNPTFVTVQQNYYISSWTLPVMFPNHGANQKYTSIERLLCPPDEQQHRNETVQVRLTTESVADVAMNVRLVNQSFVLKMGDTVTVKATPVAPDYRLYQWTADQTSVLVTAESRNHSGGVCGILALQNAKCPVVYDELGLRAAGGRFQTFTTGAAMVASRTEYPNGIHMIVWPLPDNDACTLVAENESNHTSRQKSVVFQVFSHSSIGSTWYIFLVTGAVVVFLILGITMISLKVIENNLSFNFRTVTTMADDERELLEEDDRSSRVTRRGFAAVSGVAVLGGVDNGFMSSTGSRQSQVPTAPGAEGVGDPGLGAGLMGSIQSGSEASNGSLVPVAGANCHPPYSPPTTYAPHPAAMQFTPSFNPVYVMWWKRYALFESETAEAQVSEMGFQHNLLIMAVFAALPTTELIRSYLKMLTYHGDEDQCFFNSRCLTGLWIFHDFARVFTNLGYIVAGAAFTRIVLRHKYLTHLILNEFTAENSAGVSRHYGLFISLGYGLVIQGLMSSLYHTCPNSVTIRFDMMFMYVMTVAAVVSIWGLRHGDITHHVYPTMGLIGISLLLAEGREWVSRVTFWLFMCSSYGFLVLTTTLLMARYGVWSFSPLKMLQVWKGWKPVRNKLAQILRDEDRTSTPLHILRIISGVVANGSLILYGAIADPNVYNYILTICLTNLGLYFGNYILTKTVCYREKGTILAWMCLAMSFVFWILAITAFGYRSTNSEASASDSRAINSPCNFFGVFDTHDIWHLLSSLGLFTFFLGLLTLDDDISKVPSKQIHVF